MLKQIPAIEWMDKVDPDKAATCMVGIRREESQNRATFPEWTTASEKHGGRELWAPLVRHTKAMRDELLSRTPFKPLPHRSKECYPCTNCNQAELKLLDEPTILKLEDLENEMGINSKGNPRVMFRPERHGGAVGIREVVNDAQRYNEDLFPASDCDGGWCGS